MTTKLFLRNEGALATVLPPTNGTGHTRYGLLDTTAGPSLNTKVSTSVASGTEIEMGSGDSTRHWITKRAPAGGFTLTSADISLWFKESNMSANCGGRVRLFDYFNEVETEIGGGPFNDGVEWGTTDGEFTWTADVTDTFIAENHRLVLRIYATNVGTMGDGFTLTISYGGADAATGDSFLTIAETVTFKDEETILHITSTAAAAVTTSSALLTNERHVTTTAAGVTVAGSATLANIIKIDSTIAGVTVVGTATLNTLLAVTSTVASSVVVGAADLSNTRHIDSTIASVTVVGLADLSNVRHIESSLSSVTTVGASNLDNVRHVTTTLGGVVVVGAATLQTTNALSATIAGVVVVGPADLVTAGDDTKHIASTVSGVVVAGSANLDNVRHVVTTVSPLTIAGAALLTNERHVTAALSGVTTATGDVVNTRHVTTTIPAGIVAGDADLSKTIKLTSALSSVVIVGVATADVRSHISTAIAGAVVAGSASLQTRLSFTALVSAAVTTSGEITNVRYLTTAIDANLITGAAVLASNAIPLFVKGRFFDMPDVLDLLTGETRTFLIKWDDSLAPPQKITAIQAAGVTPAPGPLVTASSVHIGKRGTWIQLAAGDVAGLFALGVKTTVAQRLLADVTEVIRVAVRVSKYLPVIPSQRMHLEERINFGIDFSAALRDGEKIIGIQALEMDRTGGGSILTPQISNSGKALGFKIDNPTVMERYRITARVTTTDGSYTDTVIQYANLEVG